MHFVILFAIVFNSLDTGFVQFVIYMTCELEVFKYMAGKIGTSSDSDEKTKMLKSLIKYYLNIFRLVNIINNI